MEMFDGDRWVGHRKGFGSGNRVWDCPATRPASNAGEVANEPWDLFRVLPSADLSPSFESYDSAQEPGLAVSGRRVRERSTEINSSGVVEPVGPRFPYSIERPEKPWARNCRDGSLSRIVVRPSSLSAGWSPRR